MSEPKIVQGKGISGKLEYIGSTSIVCIESKGSRRISIATVLTEGVDIDTNCKYPVDFQANAERFVKCNNCHDDLVTACEAIKRRIHFIGLPSEPPDWAKEIALIEAALAKAK